ncbi:alpha/beta hydrolase [Steroidobacter cummioxidans]|uniref:alpha/beta hydrolase n=1 Tax=Steroidobacter cummioxidans TaxID=1803913 RepID=UPI000E310F6E|nr:alpha/beta fold hydrolase [Steroidobacter cummioxidans]
MPYLLIVLLFLTAKSLAAEQPIELQTGSGTLHGTLSTPASAGPFPIALIIAGSGPTDRDGNSAMLSGKNDGLKMLALALADAGFAAVRYDKRGVGKSAAAAVTEADLRFDHYVEDARAWIEQLSKDQRFRGVAVIGHSEGSLIGMIASQGTRAAAFVSIAGAGEPASATLRRQLRGRFPPALIERNEAILKGLEAGELSPDVPQPLMPLYRPSVQPYLVSWFRYSPTIEIAKLTLPGLIVQGDTDIQVTVTDAESLQQACKQCELRIVRGMNHVLKLVLADPGQQAASYGDPSLPVAPDLIQSIGAFLARSTKSVGNADPLK